MLGVLLGAAVLTLFHLDEIYTEMINSIFGTTFSTNVYWFSVLIVGVLVYLIEKIKRKQS